MIKKEKEHKILDLHLLVLLNILFSILNTLIYICFSIFQVLFLDVINNFLFIY